MTKYFSCIAIDEHPLLSNKLVFTSKHWIKKVTEGYLNGLLSEGCKFSKIMRSCRKQRITDP